MLHLILTLSILVQTLLPQIISDKTSDVRNIFHDLHGNTYILSDTHLDKYNQENKITATYDLPSSGYIKTVDVSNPMRILIYSEIFNSVIFLDNQLNAISDAIQLDEKEVYHCAGICTAYRGGFWLFDNDKQQIVHYNDIGNLDIESGQINTENTKPNIIIEYNKYIYLGFEKQSILVFDQYGAYIKRLPLKYENKFILRNNNIIFLKNEKIIQYNQKTLETKILASPIPEFTDFSLLGESLFLIVNGEIIQEKTTN
jgi:hypothetical protein